MNAMIQVYEEGPYTGIPCAFHGENPCRYPDGTIHCWACWLMWRSLPVEYRSRDWPTAPCPRCGRETTLWGNGYFARHNCVEER